MNVIAKRAFDKAAAEHPQYANLIYDVYKTLEKNDFTSSQELKAMFPSLDKFNFKHLKNWYVIDIAGNNLRLLIAVLYSTQQCFVKYIVDHAEYDRLTKRARSGEKL